MTFDDIKGNKVREEIFPQVLEEACRQWCGFIEEAPERKSGEGFADFFYEIFESRELEYAGRLFEQQGMAGHAISDDRGNQKR